MDGERQDSRWLIRPSLWFDAVCLIPLLAGLPFYTSRHEQDARWWQDRFTSIAGPQARDGVSVLRDEVADRGAKPLPAFLALWTSPAAGPSAGAAEGLDSLVAAVADPELLVSAMRERSPRWNEVDDRLFRSVRPALLAVLEGLRAAGLADWWTEHAAALDQFLNIQLGRNTRGDPVTRWTAADDGMHVLALLLYDALRHGGYDPAAGSYGDFLATVLSDEKTWPRDLEARYLELTATRAS